MADTPQSTFETARLAMARLRVGEDARDLALREATRISAQTLGVARVGLWLLAHNPERIVCEVAYDEASGAYQPTEAALDEVSAPRYFQAIRARRAVVASDALHDPATSELLGYLAPRGITSMLDAPVFLGGEIAGVVCHEHVGPPRVWTQHEIDFACSVADIVSVLLEQAEHYRLREELRRLTERADSSRRLDVLTRVTRSFAHDLQNVLTVTTLVGSRLETDPVGDRRGLGRGLRDAAALGGRILRQLSAFAMRAELAPDPAPVGEAVETMRPVLEMLCSGNARLSVDVSGGDAIADVPRAQLEQILLNLVLNACEAARGGRVAVVIRAEGAHLTIEVRDDGPGIPRAELGHVFDPYFVASPPSAGIGLTTIRDLVVSHGGTIAVDSVEGRGTSFRVTMPRLT